MPVDQQTRRQDLRTRYDEATAHLDPPLAIVDLAAFDHNTADMARRANGRPIRIATKSVRCRQLIERALTHPGYYALMAYSLPEALWLHEQGLSEDILVAYPTVNRQALRQLGESDAARQHITIMVDEIAHLDIIEEAAGRSTSAPAGHRCTRRNRPGRSPRRSPGAKASSSSALWATRARSRASATFRPDSRPGHR
jgi:D-serine deaminase-like pyridoxal phosphate-dependent protein